MEKPRKKPYGPAFWCAFGRAAAQFAAVAALAALLLPGGAAALPEDPAALARTALLAGVVRPVFEEAFYRGLVQQLLERLAGPRWALAGQAVVFGLAHGTVPQKLYGFAMGLVLGGCAEKTGRVWPGAVLHSINNWIVLAGCLAGRGV